MSTTFIKGLIMTVIITVATLFTEGSNINMAIVSMTVVASVLIYLGQNKWFPSTSPAVWLNIQDILIGLFLAIGTGLMNSLATLIVGNVICWACLWKLMAAVIIGYLTKTTMQATPDVLAPKKFFVALKAA